MSKANKELVRRMYEEAWNEGRLEVVDEICSPDYRGIGPYGNEMGPDSVKIGISSRRAAFPDVHVSIDDLVSEGDKVVCRLTFTGTHRGEYQGFAPTGKSVTWTGIWIYRVADEKFVERWHNWDLLGLLEQLRGGSGEPITLS